MAQTRGHDLSEVRRETTGLAGRFSQWQARAPRYTSVQFICVLAFSIAPAISGALEPVVGMVSTEANSRNAETELDAVRHAPRISGMLDDRTAAKLEEAFQVAVEHVRDNPGCLDLFAQFGADGLEKLSTSLYYRSDVTMERRFCGSGVSAFTIIGSPQVRLCRRFGSLATERAAAALVHEALHFAGMTETPRDPTGPSPAEIDRLVRKACKF